MKLTAHKMERSGLELWGVWCDSKLVGSFWTENAARTRIAELARALETALDDTPECPRDEQNDNLNTQTNQESDMERSFVKCSSGARSGAVGADTHSALEIMASLRAHWNAPFPTKSPDYDTWKAKSHVAKLLDDDTNEVWEARLRRERAAEESTVQAASLKWERKRVRD